MGLDERLRANAEFVAAGVPALAGDDAPELLVIAASSPGLVGLLDAALGLERGRAVVIQLADAWGGRDGEDLERTLLIGMHQYGCREILVVGDEGDPCLQPDRQLLRARLREAGIEPDSAEADRLSAFPACNHYSAVDESVASRCHADCDNALPHQCRRCSHCGESA